MNKQIIKEIEEALKLHINYEGDASNKYLKKMDRLAINYKGSLSQKLCSLLKDYYEEVGVTSLDEAFNRLRKIESKEI